MVRQVHGKEAAWLQWRVTDNSYYQISWDCHAIWWCSSKKCKATSAEV